jgi:hypothetical protein
VVGLIALIGVWLVIRASGGKQHPMARAGVGFVAGMPARSLFAMFFAVARRARSGTDVCGLDAAQ